MPFDLVEGPYKECTKCGGFLPLVSFYADARRQDGKRADCMKCNRLRGRVAEKSPEGRALNLLRVKAYQARQREKLNQKE